MAEKPKGGKIAKKSKSNPRWKLYKITGDKLERLSRYCPKCGVGTFMARHKDRFSCGKCGFTEMTKK